MLLRSSARTSFSFSAFAALALALVVATLASASARAASVTTKAPNIVFILADDLGYGDIHALNPDGKIATPQLDKLTASALTFTEAHSSSAVCTPSRYSILTGRYNWRSTLKQGVRGGFGAPLIEDGRLTVAELLKSHGYHTAAIGKWHLGLDWARKDPAAKTVAAAGETAENVGSNIDFTQPVGRGPVTLGFDEYFGISASLDMPPYTFIHNDRVVSQPTFDHAFPWIGIDHKEKKTRNGPTAPDFQAVDVLPTLKQHAIDYIGQRAAEARAGKPFFLYLPLNAPHTPLVPTPEWKGKSGLNDYADFVMEVDAMVGEVIAALDQNGVADNTLVVFTSDNGCSPEADYPYLASHGHDPSATRRGYKADIYDGGHRIPLLVRWPGHTTAGAKSDGFVCLGDFMATCAEILGEKLPANAAEDSFSFLPLLAGKPNAASRDTLVLHSINGSFGIRQGQWKLELCPDSGGWSYPRPGKDSTEGMPRFQLFDLAADPGEKTNVLADHPDVVARLGHLMSQLIANGRSTPGPAQKNDPITKWPQTTWMAEFK